MTITTDSQAPAAAASAATGRVARVTGAVVDIDRTSGRPLQSAAKTPFMATFKVRRAVAERENPHDPPYVDVWQSAIFKVGDDWIGTKLVQGGAAKQR